MAGKSPRGRAYMKRDFPKEISGRISGVSNQCRTLKRVIEIKRHVQTKLPDTEVPSFGNADPEYKEVEDQSEKRPDGAGRTMKRAVRSWPISCRPICDAEKDWHERSFRASAPLDELDVFVFLIYQNPGGWTRKGHLIKDK